MLKNKSPPKKELRGKQVREEGAKKRKDQRSYCYQIFFALLGDLCGWLFG
jgi:hypothetical protein